MNEQNVKPNSLKAWILAARPKTLTGALVPVSIGLALAWADLQAFDGNYFSWTAAVLCLVFAMLMQIDANFINDFIDYVRGNDDASTRLGPLRACTQGWVKISSMKHAIALTTCLACAVGLPLVWFGGLRMIAVGLACVVFCFLYTTHLSYIGLGDVLVFLFFGIIPVCVTYFIQVQTCTWQVFIASLACGAVVDCLLIVNNYRDRDNDRRDGKRTLVVIIGEEASEKLFLMLGVGAVLAGIVFWLNHHPLAFLLPLFYGVMHVLTWRKMRTIHAGRELNVCLAETARNILIYGITVVVGLLL